MTGDEMIAHLGLEPLTDEGGWFRSLWRAEDESASCIYYLIRKGERSRWHQIGHTSEVWTWCAGGTLEMTLGGRGETPAPECTVAFGPRREDRRYAAVVPAGHWQTTRLVDGDFALVTCVCTPAFRDSDCYLPHPPIEKDL